MAREERMSRSGRVRVFGLAVGLAFASVALAQNGSPLAERRLEGRVVSVDPQDHSLTVDWSARAPVDPEAAARYRATARDERSAWTDESGRRASTTKLTVAPRATVVRDGLNVRIDEVQPGDDVRASFMSDDLARTRPWQLEVRSPDGVEAPWGVGTGG
jgi:hypothetical protein